MARSPIGPVLVTVEALEAFTVTTPYGQYHGDPDSERNRYPGIPETAAAHLLATGRAALIAFDGQSDDAAGEPTTSTVNETQSFEMRHTGFGRYAVSGPGFPPDTIVQGKAEAERLIADARRSLEDGDGPPNA